MLLQPDRTRSFQVETDASDIAIGVVVSQPNDDGTLHLLGFYSQKFTAPKINYPVYKQQLATIISAFTEWRPYLVGAQHRIQVLTDHRKLIYFTTSRRRNRRQARWLSFIARSCFDPALSQRPDFLLGPGDGTYSQQSHCLLRPDQFQIFATSMLHYES